MLALVSQRRLFDAESPIALNEAGVEQELPCIFQDIATDARLRMSEFRDADTDAERIKAYLSV